MAGYSIWRSALSADLLELNVKEEAVVLTISRSSAIVLAALRIYAGLFWAEKGIRQKLFDPTWLGPRGDCAFVVHQMLSNAPGWYQMFLHAVVVLNITVFGSMVEWGETLVGVSLLLGLLSRFGAIGGLFLSFNYWLGNGAGAFRDGWFGFDTATFMMTCVHAVIATGLFFGIDALISRGRKQREIGKAENPLKLTRRI